MCDLTLTPRSSVLVFCLLYNYVNIVFLLSSPLSSPLLSLSLSLSLSHSLTHSLTRSLSQFTQIIKCKEFKLSILIKWKRFELMTISRNNSTKCFKES